MKTTLRDRPTDEISPPEKPKTALPPLAMLNRTYPLARRLLFQLNPERAHDWSMRAMPLADRTGLLRVLADRIPPTDPVTCMGIAFPNPVGLAAGLDKDGDCLDALGRLGFGFVEAGTFTPRPQPGNPKPRLFRLKPQLAIINRMGFNNPGIEMGVANLAKSRSFHGVVGINIGKNKDTPNEHAVEDYLACLRAAWNAAGYIAVNLSSPNTPGLRDLQAADSAARLLERLQQEQTRLTSETGRRVPVALKVAPDLDEAQIDALARVFLDAGLDALIATNTTVARPDLAGHPRASETGGLSGAPLARLATEVIAAFHAAMGTRVPIIGVGGILTAADALDKLNAGATLVQLYTGFIYRGPRLVHDIIKTLPKTTANRQT